MSAWFTVGKMPKWKVARSASSWRSAAPGSKSVMQANPESARSAAASGSTPLMWQSGSGHHHTSSLVSP